MRALLSFLWAGLALTAVADSGKNLHPVAWRTLPSDFAEDLRDLSRWDFGFRPYGKSADQLWTDPNVVRQAVGDGTSEKAVTALNVACDESGFTVQIYCGEPRLKTYLAATNDYPSPSQEVFVVTGDAEAQDLRPHFMFFTAMPGGPRGREMKEVPELMETRDYRELGPYLTWKDQECGKAIVRRMHFRWSAFWDRLPVFPEKRDNFWRLSVIRWADGGQTWGGLVHQTSQAGYLRWPDFTEAQRLAIMSAVLKEGWNAFRDRIAVHDLAVAKVPSRLARHREEHLKTHPQSFVNPVEDPEFRPTLERLIAECNALGPGIAAFGTMAPESRDEFYRRAAEKLFGFKYDVEAALGAEDEAWLMKAAKKGGVR